MLHSQPNLVPNAFLLELTFFAFVFFFYVLADPTHGTQPGGQIQGLHRHLRNSVAGKMTWNVE